MTGGVSPSELVAGGRTGQFRNKVAISTRVLEGHCQSGAATVGSHLPSATTSPSLRHNALLSLSSVSRPACHRSQSHLPSHPGELRRAADVGQVGIADELVEVTEAVGLGVGIDEGTVDE